MSDRPPVAFATYHANVVNAIGERMGPNTLGEYLWVVSAQYDMENKTTRLGFSYMPPKVGPVKEQPGAVQR